MHGLEISKKYYEDCFKETLFSEFSGITDKVAVGLCGSGSECFGFDDDISRDHDFEPGFCIFIPGEDIIDRRTAFLLQRAYDKLPKEYEGLRRSLVSPVGGSRHGVIRIEDYVNDKLGGFPFSTEQWLGLPSYSMAEAVNGQIWYDGYGQISKIREYVKDMPEDIRLKRLAGQLLLMAQSGQYNVERCMDHGEMAAAQLAVNEFVKAGLESVFLLNRKYMPFYKWSFRALRDLNILSGLNEAFEYLLMDGAGDRNGKLFTIGEVCHAVQEELRRQSITSMECDDMEKHAYSVNDHIKDGNIRGMNILCSV
ncbi:MAG: DUF4037 domain-containing protein [Firmicutes bacterium]|nr:DUF4037 domain-containing protein [Bacillota bacterium]